MRRRRKSRLDAETPRRPARRMPVEEPPIGVPVSCPGCGFGTKVNTRDFYALLEDLHIEACEVRELDIDGTVDDILDLPPR